ncbi:unnamed protein product [Onchocerca flexuosa]|uniref:CUE domain-containing protein n=1 Tax=Onchocerca flexuosa TaxID=387005 RepID=A0A183HPA6_9BILA|nr:unnamed protein product [Onchocerca flexuosa]
MFPQFDITTIVEFLRETGSVQAAVENILDSRLQQNIESDEDVWNAEETSLSSNSSTESSSEYEEALQPLESSKPDSVERHDILSQKRDALIQLHRKRYIESSRGADLRNIYGEDIPDTRNPDSLKQKEE